MDGETRFATAFSLALSNAALYGAEHEMVERSVDELHRIRFVLHRSRNRRDRCRFGRVRIDGRKLVASIRRAQRSETFHRATRRSEDRRGLR